MKITIYKQPLEIIPYQEVELPGTGVSLLSVGMEQGSGLTLWFESYDDGTRGTRPKRRVQVFVVPTERMSTPWRATAAMPVKYAVTRWGAASFVAMD